jgi:hypothetical protein
MIGRGYSHPLAPYDEAYSGGYVADVRLSFRLPSAPRVVLYGGEVFGQQWVDMEYATNAESVTSFIGEAGVGFSFLDPAGLSVTPYVFGSWGGGFTDWSMVYSTYQPGLGGGLWAELPLTDRFGLYTDFAYSWTRQFLSRGRLAVGVRHAMSFQQPEDPGRLFDVRYDRVFPAFYKYYADHPLATASLANVGERAIQDLEITFYVEEYMAEPVRCGVASTVEPGGVVPVSVYALFSPQVLSVSESTVAQATFEIRYSVNGRGFVHSESSSVRLEDRNAMTWKDDARAAAFVTALDQAVLAFMKNATASVDDIYAPFISQDVIQAVTAYQALQLFGMSYVEDPNTPYADLASTTDALDFLQFPRQTLIYGAGDCDDLSILYCALLEAVGTSTAFVTLPGHIFPAVRLGDIGSGSPLAYGAIEAEGAWWLPVEITMLNQGFRAAATVGAQQWSHAAEAGTVNVIPIEQAWGEYEPVGFSADLERLAWPDRIELSTAVREELELISRRELQEPEERLLYRLAASPGNPRLLNRIGSLYAQYGLLDEARIAFEEAARGGHAPAIVNLGNLDFISHRYDDALLFYSNAVRQDQSLAAAWLGLARSRFAIGDYSGAAESYRQLNEVDSELAATYSYVSVGADGGARASGRSLPVPWIAEEE